LINSANSRKSGDRSKPWLKAAGACFAWLGIIALAVSFENGPSWLICLGGFSIAAAFVVHDLGRARHGAVSPITVFAFSSGLTALANATGLMLANTRFRSQYFTYAADDYLMFAARLSVVGMLMTIIGFKGALRLRNVRVLFKTLPRVHGNFPDRFLLFGGPVLAVAAIAIHARLSFGLVGSVLSTVYLTPHIVAFLLARASTARRLRGALVLALVVAALEGARALFMAYLRTDIVSPFIAVALGALLGARSFEPLRSKAFLPLYIFGVVFIVYFGAFARARTTGTGVQRLEAVADGTVPGQPLATQQRPGFWARLTNFNQLSQVGRVAAEDGYLRGQTLEYLGFVFVPRFLWPDKPIVQKGGWFAWRIGQAWIRPDGRYSNGVNMTVPGELYLNFGWLGAVVGCIFFGALVALLWSRTGFWSKHSSAVGGAFGYYLFWISLTLGADLQMVVTLLATYAIFVAIGVALRLIPRHDFAPARAPRHVQWAHPGRAIQSRTTGEL